MSVDGRTTSPVTAPPLPTSIWVVAWASLAGQALVIAVQGLRSDDGVSLALSVVLGGLIVGWVSAGVIRARTVRLVVAWIVLVLTFLVELTGIVDLDDLGQAALHLLALTTSVLALVGLARFHGSPWFAWQRANPSAGAGVPIGRLLAIAVLVGVLGGLVPPAGDGVDIRVDVVGP